MAELNSAVDAITLLLKEYAVKEMADMPTLVQSAHMESYIDALAHSLILRFRAGVLSDELVTDKKKFTFIFDSSTSGYLNWWEHFKADVFPAWLKCKFPPRLIYSHQTHKETRTVNFTKYATYPLARINIPELGKPVYKFLIERYDNG